jgi:hypothetical protein
MSTCDDDLTVDNSIRPGEVGHPAEMAPAAAPDPSFNTRIPFTRAEARAAGISWRQLAGSSYHRLFHDRYVAADIPIDPVARARAALAVGGEGARLSHHTAARLLGGVVPDDPDTHLTVPGGANRSRRAGLKVHTSALPAVQVAVRAGLPCSGAVQCVLEMSTALGLVDLVVLGDSLVARDHVTPEELVVAADGWTGRGARLARRAMRLVRAGVGSPMETRLRLLIVLAGLPEPIVDHVLFHEDGRIRYRLDLSYPQWRIAIEYEGRHHAESDAQWAHDITRREVLDELGWRLIVVRSADVFATPSATLDRILVALDGRGARDVRVRSTDWMRHFPGHRAA